MTVESWPSAQPSYAVDASRDPRLRNRPQDVNDKQVERPFARSPPPHMHMHATDRYRSRSPSPLRNDGRRDRGLGRSSFDEYGRPDRRDTQPWNRSREEREYNEGGGSGSHRSHSLNSRRSPVPGPHRVSTSSTVPAEVANDVNTSPLFSPTVNGRTEASTTDVTDSTGITEGASSEFPVETLRARLSRLHGQEKPSGQGSPSAASNSEVTRAVNPAASLLSRLHGVHQPSSKEPQPPTSTSQVTSLANPPAPASLMSRFHATERPSSNDSPSTTSSSQAASSVTSPTSLMSRIHGLEPSSIIDSPLPTPSTATGFVESPASLRSRIQGHEQSGSKDYPISTPSPTASFIERPDSLNPPKNNMKTASMTAGRRKSDQEPERRPAPAPSPRTPASLGPAPPDDVRQHVPRPPSVPPSSSSAACLPPQVSVSPTIPAKRSRPRNASPAGDTGPGDARELQPQSSSTGDDGVTGGTANAALSTLAGSTTPRVSVKNEPQEHPLPAPSRVTLVCPVVKTEPGLSSGSAWAHAPPPVDPPLLSPISSGAMPAVDAFPISPDHIQTEDDVPPAQSSTDMDVEMAEPRTIRETESPLTPLPASDDRGTRAASSSFSSTGLDIYSPSPVALPDLEKLGDRATSSRSSSAGVDVQSSSSVAFLGSKGFDNRVTPPSSSSTGVYVMSSSPVALLSSEPISNSANIPSSSSTAEDVESHTAVVPPVSEVLDNPAASPSFSRTVEVDHPVAAFPHPRPCPLQWSQYSP